MKKIFVLLILCLSKNTFAYDESIVIKTETYLRNLNIAAIDFTQVNPDGSKAFGKFLIEKPFKFRCNYYPPYPLLIVGNKNFVSVYDFELEQLSRLSAKDNILSFILTNEGSLKNRFNIVDAYEQDNSYYIILALKDDNYKVHIKLSKAPISLIEIGIVDLNKDTTSIEFTNIRLLQKINKDLFIIKSPEIFGHFKQLNETELNKELFK